MFDNLSDKLEKSFKLIKGQGRITEINIADALKDVRRALVDADVSYKIAKDFVTTVKDKAMGADVLKSVKPKQQIIKIVHDELAELMGGEQVEINIEGNPTVILIAGLQGSGKTTFAAKLAKFLKEKKGKSPLLVAGDVYRPAAIEQLQVLGEQVGIPIYTEEGNKNPVKIAKAGIKKAKQSGNNIVIVDTAGRLAIDEQMMTEISDIKKSIKPQETLFVVDAMTGQDAVHTAKEFHNILDFDGVVLTKLDGDTRGGAALTVRTVVKKPIKFVGIGEKLDALDVFYPDRMADRILGMGDVVSLVEKAQEQIDEEEARRIKKRISKDQFDFNDFLKQLGQIKKMGNIKDLVSMIPGMGKAVKNMDIDDDAFKGIEAIIFSMTPDERANPKLMNGSRRKRIADGSGSSTRDVNQLLKQFKDTKKMMKMVSGGGSMGNAMKNLQRR